MDLSVPAILKSLVRLSAWLTVLAVVFVPLERLFAVHPRKLFRPGIWQDVGYYFLNSLLPAALLSLPLGLLAWVTHRFVPGGWLEFVASLPLWARLGAGLVVGEIGYYWGHRLSHEIPFLWRFHSIHHGAPEMDFLVNTHAHPVDMVFSRLCGLVPMYVLGLAGPAGKTGSLIPLLVSIFGIAWGFFVHSNVRWRFGPLEWLISTPMFHHWHHTLSGPVNRNYSATLPWIDRLFGTLHLPKKEWPAAYGIEAQLPPTLAGQLVYPLRAQPTLPDREGLPPAADRDPAGGAVGGTGARGS